MTNPDDSDESREIAVAMQVMATKKAVSDLCASYSKHETRKFVSAEHEDIRDAHAVLGRLLFRMYEDMKGYR